MLFECSWLSVRHVRFPIEPASSRRACPRRAGGSSLSYPADVDFLLLCASAALIFIHLQCAGAVFLWLRLCKLHCAYVQALDAVLKVERVKIASENDDFAMAKQRLLNDEKDRIRDIVHAAFEPLRAKLPGRTEANMRTSK